MGYAKKKKSTLTCKTNKEKVGKISELENLLVASGWVGKISEKKEKAQNLLPSVFNVVFMKRKEKGYQASCWKLTLFKNELFYCSLIYYH